MSQEFSISHFDFRGGLLLDEVCIEETPIAAETINLPDKVLGDRAIQAAKTIADFSYSEAKISRDGKDYWIVGQNTQIRAGMIAVFGVEDERWVPFNKQAYYAGLIAVSAKWSGIERLPALINENIIQGVRAYADELRAELST